MVITFTKHLVTDTLILNEKEVCPGCGCVCPCECTKNFFHKNLKVSLIIFPVYLFFISIYNPVFAHHPFGMGESSTLTSWQGFISGIGHPLLGPDHLLFGYYLY